MANRNFTRESFQLEKNVCRLYAQITFGASGAPTIVTANSKGIYSVTRNSAGKYTIVFGSNSRSLDGYQKLLMVKHTWDETANSGTAPLAPLMYLLANNVTTSGGCSLQVEFTNSTGAQIATDPASGEKVFIEFHLGNSVSY